MGIISKGILEPLYEEYQYWSPRYGNIGAHGMGSKGILEPTV